MDAERPAKSLQERADTLRAACPSYMDAFRETLRSALDVVRLTIADHTAPDLDNRLVGAGLRTAAAARELALAVAALPEDERPIGWCAVVDAERVYTVLAGLSEPQELPQPDLPGFREGWNAGRESAAVLLRFALGSPGSSPSAGTGSRFGEEAAR